MTAPHRRIVETAGSRRRTRQGIIKTAVLECGHITDCNATQRRRGWLHCWDCFYGKPADSMAEMILNDNSRRDG